MAVASKDILYAVQRRRVSYSRSDNPTLQFLHTSQSLPFTTQPYRDLVDKPGWKALVEKKLDASNPYTRYDVKQIPGVFRSYESGVSSGVKFVCNGDFVFTTDPSFLVSTADDNALRDLALARLKRKLSSRTNQVNVMIPLVEIRELRSVIRAIAYSTMDLIVALINIKKTKGKSAYKFAAHAWLAFSFGIRPTLIEANEILESIDSFIQKSGDGKFTDYGAAKKMWKTSATRTAAFGYNSTATFAGELFHQLSYRYTCGYSTPLKAANNYRLEDQFGLNFGAMVPAVWELTPFSWVFDYFSTIGAYLDDAFIADLTQTIYVVLTKKYVCNATFPVGRTVHGFNQSGYSSLTGRNHGFKAVYVQRTPLSSLPVRSLRFKTSDEIGKNAVNKLLNLTSVLVGGKAHSNRL